MKNQNRIRNKGSAGRASRQAKVPKEFALPKGDAHPSCLAIYDRSSQGLVSKIPLTEKEFFDALTFNAGKGNGAAGFFAQAVREKLSGRMAQVDDPLSELEEAKNQSAALITLMLDSETHHLMEGDLNDTERDRLNAGVAELVSQTNERLQNAFIAVFHAIHPQSEESA
jgi:hypothetical protein